MHASGALWHHISCYVMPHRGEEGEGQGTGDGEADPATQYAEGQHNTDEAESGQDDADSQLPVNTLFYGVRGQQVCPACDMRGREWGTWGWRYIRVRGKHMG